MSDDNSLDRRAILRATGGAITGAAVLSGVKSANGRGRANGQGRGNAKTHGRGNENARGNAIGRGPPFAEPTVTNVVFCGCSQVCVRNANCCSAYVVVEDGPNHAIKGNVPECVVVSEGKSSRSSATEP